MMMLDIDPTWKQRWSDHDGPGIARPFAASILAVALDRSVCVAWTVSGGESYAVVVVVAEYGYWPWTSLMEMAFADGNCCWDIRIWFSFQTFVPFRVALHRRRNALVRWFRKDSNRWREEISLMESIVDVDGQSEDCQECQAGLIHLPLWLLPLLRWTFFMFPAMYRAYLGKLPIVFVFVEKK